MAKNSSQRAKHALKARWNLLTRDSPNDYYLTVKSQRTLTLELGAALQRMGNVGRGGTPSSYLGGTPSSRLGGTPSRRLGGTPSRELGRTQRHRGTEEGEFLNTETRRHRGSLILSFEHRDTETQRVYYSLSYSLSPLFLCASVPLCSNIHTYKPIVIPNGYENNTFIPPLLAGAAGSWSGHEPE